MLQRQSCVVVHCDLCGDGPSDPSMELHYPSEDAALDALAVLGWDLAADGGRLVCPDCSTVLGCEEAGHEFIDWQHCGCGQLLAAHRRGTAGRCGLAFRYCRRCCLHESRPAPDTDERGVA